MAEVEASELVERIERAFSDVPKGPMSIHEAERLDHCRVTRADQQLERSKDCDSRWQDIPDAAIEECCYALAFFDVGSWRYHIPAYMRWSVANLFSSGGRTTDTIVSLDPTDERSGSRIRSLSQDQRRVACDFLRFMAAHPDDADAESARDALERIQRGIYLVDGPK